MGNGLQNQAGKISRGVKCGNSGRALRYSQMMAVKWVLFTVLNRLIESLALIKWIEEFQFFFFNKIGLSSGKLLWNCSVQHYCYPFSCTSLADIKQVISADLNV